MSNPEKENAVISASLRTAEACTINKHPRTYRRPSKPRKNPTWYPRGC